MLNVTECDKLFSSLLRHQETIVYLCNIILYNMGNHQIKVVMMDEASTFIRSLPQKYRRR